MFVIVARKEEKKKEEEEEWGAMALGGVLHWPGDNDIPPGKPYKCFSFFKPVIGFKFPKDLKVEYFLYIYMFIYKLPIFQVRWKGDSVLIPWTSRSTKAKEYRSRKMLLKKTTAP